LGRYIGLPELLLVFPLVILLGPLVFYLLALRKALSVCSQENRTLSPGLVWLLLVPLFNFLWHFYVVLNVSRSIRNEFLKRRVTSPPRSIPLLGLAMCLLSVLAFAPVVGTVAGIGAFICWIVYWAKVAQDTRVISKTNLVGQIA
jgi:hypothetical protein